MANWKACLLFITILPLVKTETNQRGYEHETTAIPDSQQSYGYEEMSEEHGIEVGNRIEPVIFEPQRKIKLSRSTYKVTSYVDFKLYKQAFKQYGQYIEKFLTDIRDPHYVSTLYKAGTGEKNSLNKEEEVETKAFFTEGDCKQLTYRCRVQNQFIQLKRDAAKIKQIYLETYKKFLRAIDHMEFHPTLDRTKTESTDRHRRQPNDKDLTAQTSHSVNLREELTKDDILMLEQADELIRTKFLNETTQNKKIWARRMDNGMGNRPFYFFSIHKR